MARKKKGKEKRKGSFLEKIGLKTKPVPTEDDVARANRYENYERAWNYLRASVDRNVRHYFETGSFDKLGDLFDGPAKEAMLDQLERYRSAGIAWVQPARKERTNQRFRVISEQLDGDDLPQRFVIEERFTDYSELRSMGGEVKSADGKEQVIRATIVVKSADDYRIASVIKVPEATLQSS